MSKNDTFRSFRDLDVSHFRKKNDTPVTVLPTVAENPASLEPEDDSALFLASVLGNVDVSLKYTPIVSGVPATRIRENAEKDSAPKKAGGTLPEALEAAPSPSPTSDDEALFSRAMGGVLPINARGRDLAPESQSVQPTYSNVPADMDTLFAGKFEFSLEHTDEFVQGYVLGLDPLVFGKLKAGAYSPEAHVDLHGQNIEQAHATLRNFVKDAYQNGKRHLIIITGRGKNSPGGMPVLRERVQTWFTRDPFKRVVLGFCSAKPGDGGAGALYLLLRRRKKSHGKIIWDYNSTEEELLG